MSETAIEKRKFDLGARLKLPRFESSFASSLRDGILAGGVIFLLLCGWMALRANDTAWKMQDYLPAKSATIEEKAKVTKTAEEQPGLTDAKNLNALPAAPIEGLYENYEGHQLPIYREQDDMTPFQAYKKPFQPVAGRPVVSIVVVDFGLSDLLSKSLLDNLPADVSLVLSPYADEPAKWGSAARAYGHEFWVSLPMQTKDFGQDDSGPSTLLVSGSVEENQQRLFNILGEAVGYVGLITQKGHVFTADAPAAESLLKQIFGRGLALAESNTNAAGFGSSTAQQSGYPYVQNGFWLDEDIRPAAVERRLQELELQVTRTGKAVAFVHPYPAVMTKVEDWVKAADAKGIQIAPLSAQVQ